MDGNGKSCTELKKGTAMPTLMISCASVFVKKKIKKNTKQPENNTIVKKSVKKKNTKKKKKKVGDGNKHYDKSSRSKINR